TTLVTRTGDQTTEWVIACMALRAPLVNGIDDQVTCGETVEIEDIGHGERRFSHGTPLQGTPKLALWVHPSVPRSGPPFIGLLRLNPPPAFSNPKAMDSEPAVLAADKTFFSSLLTGAVGTLDQLLAADFLLVDVLRGAEVPKPVLLAALAAGQIRFEIIDS